MESRTHGRLAPYVALAWLGRQGVPVTAALVFISLALPGVGLLLRPFVGWAVFLLLASSFSRVDVTALRAHLRRPGLLLGITLWTAVAIPLLVGGAMLALGLNRAAPGLFLGLMLQALTSPIMSSPAIAALLGLDATLVLISLVIGTALVPLTAPLFAYMFLGGVLVLSPATLGLQLGGVLLGAVLVAAIVRRVAGVATLERHGQVINGCNVLLLFVFIAALLGDVAPHASAQPLRTFLVLLLATAVSAGLLFSTVALFRRAGRHPAWTLGFMVSQRNMGLMLAVTGGVLPADTWLYFAMSQFPIYLWPMVLRKIIKPQGKRA